MVPTVFEGIFIIVIILITNTSARSGYDYFNKQKKKNNVFNNIVPDHVTVIVKVNNKKNNDYNKIRFYNTARNIIIRNHTDNGVCGACTKLRSYSRYDWIYISVKYYNPALCLSQNARDLCNLHRPDAYIESKNHIS